MFEAAAGPKEWREYDCDHDIDDFAPARHDGIAFVRESLVAHG